MMVNNMGFIFNMMYCCRMLICRAYDMVRRFSTLEQL